MRLAACFLALFASAFGCASAGGGSGRDGGEPSGTPTITVRGRVVDFESCVGGCEGAENVVVAWAGAPMEVRSEPTGPDGAFSVSGVPVGGADLLVIPQETAATLYAATLNPSIVAAGTDADVFGLTTFVVNRDGESLLAAVSTEAGFDLERDGGYLGQVAESADAGGLVAAEGVTVTYAPPADPVLYVNVLPREIEGEPALLPETATATGAFGLFVIPPQGPGQTLLAVFPNRAGGVYYDLIAAPVRPGVVTLGVHLRR